MKYSISAIFSLIAGLLTAQPILGPDVFFAAGGEVIAYDFNAENFDDGPDGANQVWDFSTIQTTGPSAAWNGVVVTPSETYNSDLFESANVAIELSSGAIRYWSNSESGIIAVGQGGYGDILEMDNPAVWMNYPFEYGSSISDDATGLIYGSCRDYQWSGTSETHGVGYGTLVTPAGSFDNVLKIRRVAFTSKVNLEKGIDRESNIVEHYWFKPGVSGPLMYMRTWNNNGCPGSNSGSEASYFLPAPSQSGQSTTSINGDIALALYPNPASDRTQLSIRSTKSIPGQIWISDMLGQPVRKISDINMIEKSNLIPLDLNNLQPGLYVVNVRTDDQHLTEKLMIQ